jgi:hypothetical protein
MGSEASIVNLQSLQITAPLGPGEGVKTILKRLARLAGFYALAAVVGAAAVVLIASLLRALDYFQAAPAPAAIPAPAPAPTAAPLAGPTLIWVLGITWAMFAAALIILLIYRSTLTMREDDQLFLNDADSYMQEEQTELLANVSHVTTFAKYAGLATGTLTLALLFVFIYYSPSN